MCFGLVLETIRGNALNFNSTIVSDCSANKIITHKIDVGPLQCDQAIYQRIRPETICQHHSFAVRIVLIVPKVRTGRLYCAQPLIVVPLLGSAQWKWNWIDANWSLILNIICMHFITYSQDQQCRHHQNQVPGPPSSPISAASENLQLSCVLVKNKSCEFSDSFQLVTLKKQSVTTIDYLATWKHTTFYISPPPLLSSRNLYSR